MSLSNYGQAKALLEDALAIGRSVGNQRGIAASLTELSRVAAEKGQIEEAEQLVRKSMAIYQRIGDAAGAVDGLYSLGCRLVYAGSFEEAHPLLAESVAIYTEQERQIHLARAADVLVWAKVNLGLYQDRRHLRRLVMSFVCLCV